MHNIALTWQQAAAVAAGLLALAVVLHRIQTPTNARLVPFARESGIIAALYSLWQLAGTLSVLGTSGAFTRAEWIVRHERAWGLPSEATVQRAVANHRLLIESCNLYYATMHFGMLFLFLLWLFLRHRDRYGQIRSVLAISTLACLLIQLIPVAPPRLLPGFIDTAQKYGESVYSLGIAPDQLSAMPSVHVAWSVLIGWSVVRLGTSKWRWLILLHPLMTLFVVTATANHFWLDGIVAVVVLAVSAAAQQAISHAVSSRRVRRASASRPGPELADAAT